MNQILKTAKALANLGADLNLAVQMARELAKRGAPVPIVRRKPKSPGKKIGGSHALGKTATATATEPTAPRKRGRPAGSKNRRKEGNEPPPAAGQHERPPNQRQRHADSFDDPVS